MQIVVKVVSDHVADAPALVARRVAEHLPAHTGGKVDVSELFPGLTRGRRAGLVTVRLPHGLSEAEVDRLVEDLQREDAVEYAELPAPKHPV
jgi:hypothetical protein